MTPDEAVFRDHLKQGPFQSGAANGRWRLIEITWPHALIAVAAAPRNNGPEEYVFRFACDNYPQTPTTTCPWDLEKNTQLAPDEWPGGSQGSRVQAAFNPGWNGGHALYLPCDRLAIQGHEGWGTKHPDMIWSSGKDITFYLRIIHDLLHSSTYTGSRSV